MKIVSPKVYHLSILWIVSLLAVGCSGSGNKGGGGKAQAKAANANTAMNLNSNELLENKDKEVARLLALRPNGLSNREATTLAENQFYSCFYKLKTKTLDLKSDPAKPTFAQISHRERRGQIKAGNLVANSNSHLISLNRRGDALYLSLFEKRADKMRSIFYMDPKAAKIYAKTSASADSISLQMKESELAVMVSCQKTAPAALTLSGVPELPAESSMVIENQKLSCSVYQGDGFRRDKLRSADVTTEVVLPGREQVKEQKIYEDNFLQVSIGRDKKGNLRLAAVDKESAQKFLGEGSASNNGKGLELAVAGRNSILISCEDSTLASAALADQDATQE